MTCEHVVLRDAAGNVTGSGILCSRGRRRRFLPCAVCGRPSSRQCDGPRPGVTRPTCNRYLCDHCATSVGAELDLCPDCVRTKNRQPELPLGGVPGGPRP